MEGLAGLKICIEEHDQTVPTILFFKVHQERRVNGFPRVRLRVGLED